MFPLYYRAWKSCKCRIFLLMISSFRLISTRSIATRCSIFINNRHWFASSMAKSLIRILIIGLLSCLLAVSANSALLIIPIRAASCTWIERWWSILPNSRHHLLHLFQISDCTLSEWRIAIHKLFQSHCMAESRLAEAARARYFDHTSVLRLRMIARSRRYWLSCSYNS